MRKLYRAFYLNSLEQMADHMTNVHGHNREAMLNHQSAGWISDQHKYEHQNADIQLVNREHRHSESTASE